MLNAIFSNRIQGKWMRQFLRGCPLIQPDPIFFFVLNNISDEDDDDWGDNNGGGQDNQSKGKLSVNDINFSGDQFSDAEPYDYHYFLKGRWQAALLGKDNCITTTQAKVPKKQIKIFIY